jgi:hypothetical protein
MKSSLRRCDRPVRVSATTVPLEGEFTMAYAGITIAVRMDEGNVVRILPVALARGRHNTKPACAGNRILLDVPLRYPRRLRGVDKRVACEWRQAKRAGNPFDQWT